MIDEMMALHSNGTWELVPCPPRQTTVGCRWVYTIKVGLDGHIDCLKARLVAKGYTKSMDLIMETIYMEQSPKFIAQGGSQLVCRLRKSLYGRNNLLVHGLQYQLENSAYQKVLAETTQMYEKKIAELTEELGTMKKLLNDHQKSMKIQGQEKIDELRERLQGMSYLQETTANELQLLKSKYQDLSQKEQQLHMEEKQRKAFENELITLKKNALETKNDNEENSFKESSEYANCIGSLKSKPSKETISYQKAALAKMCKEVGFQRILELLKSEELDIQIHALKVIANLAAEDVNQVRIVEEGGLDTLLTLLQSSKNTTILRVASGAIANLAMNEINQGLIVSKRGTRLLAETASRTVDPQTLRMVAGALANLCGNENLHMMLEEDGGIKALLEMATCGNTDVVSQVARGFANFAKCEFKEIIQGQRKGCSVLVEHGALSWLIANSNTTSASTRRHIELALCHLAQNEDNAKEFISNGGVKELERISVESNREDIRNLAQRVLRLNPDFWAEVNAEQFTRRPAIK
ncbi:hypothetical protein L6164_005737 [Bauhinia variegata]|uniref:Uncharacterized protein n=1 Tax=Bauhinia variegata TaxID=167791 RepID=A0ACB9PXL3_BAUVA|nr:hypothetical protein L6164_005737 [Bauhinia variegata]